MPVPYPIARVALLGGGQLGRMMLYEALRLGIATSVLDPSPTAPCARLADTFVCGSLFDEDKIREVAEGCDVITWEIEHVDVDVLSRLTSEGINVRPLPSVLRTIQDKLTQKLFLQSHGLPVPRFSLLGSNVGDDVRAFGLPCVLKSRRGGYDGRGVAVVNTPEEAEAVAFGEAMIEERVDIATELSVVVARTTDGSSAVYPPMEMIFAEEANICTTVRLPASVPDETTRRAREIAAAAVEALDATGVVAVELFVTNSSDILINEIAPRPHNSGHPTIEACRTNQFEQHLRGILGFPLGDPSLVNPAVMVNILGAPHAGSGPPLMFGLEEVLRVPGAAIHLYGKAEARPYRKMGHVTVTADTIEEASRRAALVEAVFFITGGET